MDDQTGARHGVRTDFRGTAEFVVMADRASGVTVAPAYVPPGAAPGGTRRP